jgi:hypothetical protein
MPGKNDRVAFLHNVIKVIHQLQYSGCAASGLISGIGIAILHDLFSGFCDHAFYTRTAQTATKLRALVVHYFFRILTTQFN